VQQPHVVHTQKPVVKKPVRAHVKPKVEPKPHRKVAVKPKPAAPKVKVSKSLGASVGLRSAAKVGPGGSTNLGSLLIVMGLSFAIACLAIAVVPARSVPWRSAAIFVSERQFDLTIIGFGLLLAIGFTLFWIRGF
jgi:hypothetical protein